MKKQKGSRFHPARISGHQKFLRAKQANEEAEKNKKENQIEPIDLKKSDWTIRGKN